MKIIIVNNVSISMSIYLWHTPLLHAFFGLEGWGFIPNRGLAGDILVFASILGLTLLLSHFSYKWIEVGWREALEKLFRVRTATGRDPRGLPGAPHGAAQALTGTADAVR